MKVLNAGPAVERRRLPIWAKWMLWTLGLIGIAPFVLLIGALFIDHLFGAPVRTPMTVEVAGTSIALDRKQIHIFLAEFERELIVLRNGAEVRRTELSIDTGGASHINVYRLDDDTLLLVDRFAARKVGLADGAVRYHGEPEDVPLRAVFIGAFDNIREHGTRNYRFILPHERPEKPVNPGRPSGRTYLMQPIPGASRTAAAS